MLSLATKMRHFSTKTEKLFGKELHDFVYSNTPYRAKNFIDGEWRDFKKSDKDAIIPDPLIGEHMFSVSPIDDKSREDLIHSWAKCNKSGLHNPMKHPQRYREWGEVIFKAAEKFHDPEVYDFIYRIMHKCMPKSDTQLRNEILVTRQFLDNFSGDNPRFTIKGFVVPGDGNDQQSIGYRFPYGPVAIISPFNFPLEIPVLQTVGALITGNKPLLKPDIRTGPVTEAFIRLLENCGMPRDSLLYLNANGGDTERVLRQGSDILRLIQFTGSSRIAERLLHVFKGKVKIEDSGFNWKILGPDVKQFDYVVSQCDQDSYAVSGQKCSAQRILFVHENWKNANFFEKFKERVQTRKLENFTSVPLLSVTNDMFKRHLDMLLKIPGAGLLWGGHELKNHSIPSVYGYYEPTAVYVPLEAFTEKTYLNFLLQEIFGPLLIVTEYDSSKIETVKKVMESMHFHLTSGITSNDIFFINDILRHTVNGVTYAGLKARTTGAPQNHFFGPGGDPRGSGIGTPDAIINTWTYHREVVYDFSAKDVNVAALKQS